jgi:rubrerythrin
MSLLDNLNRIKEIGIRKYIKEEKEKWVCRKCGSLLSVHREYCLNCGQKREYL